MEVQEQSMKRKEIVPQWYVAFCKQAKILNCYHYICFWSECKI